MRRIGFLLGGLSLALAATPVAAQGDAYPIRPVLDVFRAACPDRAAAIAALDGGSIAGWTKVDPATTPVGALLAFGRSAGQQAIAGKGKILGENIVYRRQVAGEDLFLIVSGIDANGRVVRGCRLYDPGERRLIDGTALADWVGRKPDVSLARTELTKLSWTPGFTPDQDSFESYFVPAGSPVIALVKIDGFAVKADWVDTEAAATIPHTGSEE